MGMELPFFGQMYSAKEGSPDLLPEFAELGIFNDFLPPPPSTLNPWDLLLLLLPNPAACPARDPFGHKFHRFSLAPNTSRALVSHRIKFSVFMVLAWSGPWLCLTSSSSLRTSCISIQTPSLFSCAFDELGGAAPASGPLHLLSPQPGKHLQQHLCGHFLPSFGPLFNCSLLGEAVSGVLGIQIKKWRTTHFLNHP